MGDRVTFVHAADLHLDAPFQGVSAGDAMVGAELAAATFRAFEKVVDVCVERAVDFLVLAGDVYNNADRSLRSQLRFREQLGRLDAAGIRTFIVAGNHDHLGGWSAGLELPPSAHVFSAGRVERAEVVRDGEVLCAVYGRSFGRRAETENLALGFSRDAADSLAVGVLHANVGSHAEYDPYSPCTVADLEAAGMDYWALGHIHQHEVLARDPWVVYAGSPQGLNPKETGVHGCVFVEMGPGGVQRTEFVPTTQVGWAQCEVDVSAAESLDDVCGALARAAEDVRGELGVPSVVRLSITGRTASRASLARPGALGDLLDDVRADELASQPWVWIDRLDDRTASQLDVDAMREGADFAGEVIRVADQLLAEPEEAANIVADLLAPVRSTLGGLDVPVDGNAAVVAARDELLDLLLAAGEER